MSSKASEDFSKHLNFELNFCMVIDDVHKNTHF